jgi:hypothetical protein
VALAPLNAVEPVLAQGGGVAAEGVIRAGSRDGVGELRAGAVAAGGPQRVELASVVRPGWAVDDFMECGLLAGRQGSALGGDLTNVLGWVLLVVGDWLSVR